MMKPDDPQLRQLFADLRREDETRVPAFGRLAAVPGASRPALSWPGARRVGAAALAVAAVIGGAVLFWNRAPANPPDPPPKPDGSMWARLDTSPELPWQSQVLFSEWRSPTDALLHAPLSLGLDFIKTDSKPL